MKWIVSGVIAAVCMCMGMGAMAQPSAWGRRCESQNVVRQSANAPRQAQNSPAVAAPAEPCSDADAESEAVPMPVKARTIVIDPGHGGENEGAFGVARIHEKYLTLQIALLLADRLRALMPDVEVVLTRYRDESLSLSERIEVANHLHADLFLSLHFNNSLNPDAIGFESFWAGDYWAADMAKAGVEITDEERIAREQAGMGAERMAYCFNRAMRHRFEVLDRGVKTGDYTVLTRARVPAVVLEMAFLSHASEGLSAVMPEYQSRLVQALSVAVVNYVRGM